MALKIASVSDVADYQLCTGCGACAYLEPERFRMADSLELGRRPFLRPQPAPETFEALGACPGIALQHPTGWEDGPGLINELKAGWGPVYGVWEGYALDADIRRFGSSGGAATALALFCLEKAGMAGVCHTAADEDQRYINRTVVSRSRDELLARAGSRYSPASPCEGLKQIEEGEGKHVFIGKPCDVAAAQRAGELRPKLAANLGLTVAFFCAGVPSTRGTLDLLKSVGVENPERILSLRYRGDGWPGAWTVRFLDENDVERERSLSYDDSWGFLEKYRQWRCYLCPDHTGEFADIAVGDPWYRKPVAGEPGRSLILARTRRGLAIIEAARAAGYLALENSEPDLLPRSQPNLLVTRGVLWARLRVLRALGAAVPSYRGFQMFRFWHANLSLRMKLQSLVRTTRRVFEKHLKSRVPVKEWVREDEP